MKILFLIIAITPFIGFSQQTSLSDLGFVGHVKSVRTKSYAAYEKSGVIYCGDESYAQGFGEYSADKIHLLMEFDINGYLTLDSSTSYMQVCVSYTLDKSNNVKYAYKKFMGQLSSVLTYSYDSKNRPISCCIMRAKENKCHTVIVWEYFPDKYVEYNIEKKNNSLTAKTTYFQDSKGNTTEEYTCLNFVKYDPKDTSWNRGPCTNSIGSLTNSYQYDANGFLILEKCHNNNYPWTHKYVLDNYGNIIEVVSLDTDEVISQITKKKYDSKNNLIEMTSFEKDGTCFFNEKYIYEYDAIGNWVKRTVYADNKAVFVIKREITYY